MAGALYVSIPLSSCVQWYMLRDTEHVQTVGTATSSAMCSGKNDSHCAFPAGIKQTDWQLFGFTTHSLMVCFYHRAFEKDRKKSIYIQVTSGIMGVGSSLWSYYQTTCSNLVTEICNITCVVNVWNVLTCFSYKPKMKKCGTSHQNFRQPVITLYRKENSFFLRK
jgi:hypothetical protein